MDKKISIQAINPESFQFQEYSIKDNELISNFIKEDITFNPNENYIEYIIFDLNKNILYQNNIGYTGYTIQDDNIILNPQNDLESQGFNEGQYYTLYNFLKRKLTSSVDKPFYIQDISADRTELRLNTTQISNSDVIDLVNAFAVEIQNNQGVYLDFYLNFGNNNLIIANNIALDQSNPLDPTVLIKLYEPLPELFSFNDKCWVVEKISESQAYNIELISIFSIDDDAQFISGPNFNIDIQDQINNSTPYQNLTILKSNTSVPGSGSLQYQINSLLAEKGIEINIDYTKYSDFIHFSSAQTRLENFYYKLSLIEEYNNSSNQLNISGSNIYVSSSKVVIDNKINDIITNFDGYEYFLYYESSSKSWPKINNNPPYINFSVTSSEGQTWLTDQIYSASLYDSENKDILLNAIPSYLREDENNEPYFLFTNMVGQHFDNIWLYIKDVTNKFDADNRLEFGISKDIVAQAIRDLGINIYQNNYSSNDLYSALLGLTVSGSIINIPYITGSLPTPSGYEYINNVVSSSNSSSIKPLDDVNKEIYKRIYHNIPVLLKKKGTVEGLKLLTNIYGVDDTILRINEFGGKSSFNETWDNFQNQFNYAFYTTSSGYIQVPIYVDTSSYSGGYGIGIYGTDIYGGGNMGNNSSSFTIEFRFKTEGIPNSSSYDQVLAYSPENNFVLTLEYTGSGYNSGSYSGSIPDPYNEYGTLKFIDLTNYTSSSIYLPFFNKEWWSVMYNFN